MTFRVARELELRFAQSQYASERSTLVVE